MREWSIPGSDGEAILGNTHVPREEPAGVVLIAHGFKGYKDYGMFPRIAEELASAGFIAHRFNFSHSGMTNNVETFERPDLFEKDTWNKQVFDLETVVDSVASGSLEGRGLPYVMFGHSRGGASVILAAGRWAGDSSRPRQAGVIPGVIAGVIAVSTPSSCMSLNAQQMKELEAKGFIVSPSARTGQARRIGQLALTEQQADPAGHDLLALAARITSPVLVVHGENDPTVPAACAHQLGAAIGDRAQVQIIEGADHVFNTPNPMPPDAKPSPQLQALLDAIVAFAQDCVRD